MKKIIISISILIFSFLLLSCSSYAVETLPIYDATYNDNNGAFYANGTDIVIDENQVGDTVISWDNGSQIVPSTVTIFGGGSNGTSFETSNITMQNGIVTNIIAGGVSTDEKAIANINTANIIINNGTILNKITGGGYAYSQVGTANITINNANVNNILGGGMASVIINGIYYSVGSAEEPLKSPNRVENANITVNNITIPISNISMGLIYGGGQGYSYVGNNNIIINGGNLSDSCITAGGSNGYTGNSIIEFNNGELGTFQSVNRGIVDSVTVKIAGGHIDTLYVGGETSDSEVTGKLNHAEINLLYGTIQNLEVGKSDSKPLDIDSPNYKIVTTDDIIINNDNIPKGKKIIITYDFILSPKEVYLFKNENKQINVIISTNPTGYEYLFKDNIIFKSNDENIASISSNAIITGINNGNTFITGNLLEQTSEIKVTVMESNFSIRLILLFTILPLIAIGVIALSTFV